VISIYIATANMTIEQHTWDRHMLSDAGAPEGAMRLHPCFSEDATLEVFDAWECQGAFDQFMNYLGPLMAGPESSSLNHRSSRRS
jgi:hypothetical protein